MKQGNIAFNYSKYQLKQTTKGLILNFIRKYIYTNVPEMVFYCANTYQIIKKSF